MVNLAPTSTGSATAIALIFPQLKVRVQHRDSTHLPTAQGTRAASLQHQPTEARIYKRCLICDTYLWDVKSTSELH
jgi:hypothetical protein